MIRKILASDFLSTMLSAAVNIYMYWFAYDYSHDQQMIAIVGASQLFAILLTTIGGGISDKYNKVKFMKLILILRICVLIASVLFVKTIAIPILLALFMFVMTVLNSLTAPTLESIVPLLAKDEEELYKLNSLSSTLTQIANILAIALSAFYISFLSYREVMIVSLLICILSLLVIWRVKVHNNSSFDESVLQNILKGVRYIWSKTYIRNLVPVALIMNFCFWSIYLLLPKVTIDRFDFFKASFSTLELSFSIGGIIGGTLFSLFLSKVTNRFLLFKMFIFIQGSLLLFMGLSLLMNDTTISYMLVLILWGSYALANTIVSINYFGSVQINTPNEIMGSVFGAIMSIFSLINPLAAISTSLISKFLTVPSQIILFSIIMILSSVSLSRIEGVKEAFSH